MKGCGDVRIDQWNQCDDESDQCSAPNREMSPVVANAGNCKPMTAVGPHTRIMSNQKMKKRSKDSKSYFLSYLKLSSP